MTPSPFNEDPTEQTRRELLPAMPAEAASALATNEPTWSTDQLRAEFEVLGFSAPLVVVRRRSDGSFGGSPRLYFGWQPHECDDEGR